MSGATLPGCVARTLTPKLIVLGWTLLLMVAFAASGWCGGEQIGPDISKASMSETQDWLLRRGPEFTTFQVPLWRQQWSFPSKCLLRIDIVMSANFVDVQQIKLDGLDLVKFAVNDPVDLEGIPSGWTLSIGPSKETNSYHPLLVSKHRTGEAEHLRPIGGISIFVRDHESAIRLGRALKHAAILCGAKVDAF